MSIATFFIGFGIGGAISAALCYNEFRERIQRGIAALKPHTLTPVPLDSFPPIAPHRIWPEPKPLPDPVENKELRRYIAILLEPKRNRYMQRPDQMVKTFFAFNDREKAEVFNRMALRIGIDRDVSISPPFPYRRHSWPAIMPYLHMDAAFHFGKVVLPLIDREWDTLSMVDHRIKPQHLDDSTAEIVRRWK